MSVATLHGVPSKKPFVHVILEPELIERIEDFRYGMRIPTRNAAIRWLITAGLDQNPLPEPDPNPPPKRRRKR